MLPDPTDMTDREILLTLYSAVDQFAEKALPVIAELGPTIESLSQHPMLRMLLGGKKS